MKRFLNLNTVYIVAVIIVLGVLFIPRAVDIYTLRTQGINYFTNDIENYHNNAHPIEEEFTIEIDLNNLENNKGKVLFDDGENQIYVSKVIAHNTNEYELFFRSSGSSSLGGATIISGVEHKHNNDGLISKFQAKAKATYRGDTYKLNNSDYSGLNYSDVDEFGFYLELPEELVPDFEEEGMIDVAVTNLYINLWAKKSF
ncbi:MAG: hypothetical protein R3250_01780 [Melioribacteraceae bacterium]|nr:hypothetical protein [Melioribacteraceae bacterium]